MQQRLPTIDEALALTKPTTMFLCPLSANTYAIEFLKFTIRNMETNELVFEVARESPPNPEALAAQAAQLEAMPPEMAAAVRSVRYNFPASFLDCAHVGAKLVFSVGPHPVHNFRIVERHYFREHLIKSFDFQFPFCIPNSVNEWESVYDMPPLTPEQKEDIINHPFETRSDSFYFVNGQLIMHNKAEYAYNLVPVHQQASPTRQHVEQPMAGGSAHAHQQQQNVQQQQQQQAMYAQQQAQQQQQQQMLAMQQQQQQQQFQQNQQYPNQQFYHGQ